jgi:acetyl-CoA carboxylase/biotin carboxylase 1
VISTDPEHVVCFSLPALRVPQLDSEIDNPDANPGGGEAADEIAAREKDLAPLYTQVAHEFADLHDRSGRMKAKGVIRQALEWPRAREFFYHRVKRRVAENDLVASMRVADPALTAESAKAAVADLIGAVEGDDDQKVLAALDALDTDAAIAATKKAALEAQLAAIKAEIEAL